MWGFRERCVPERIRTSGLRIRNPALYPTELRGLVTELIAVILKNMGLYFTLNFIRLAKIKPA